MLDKITLVALFGACFLTSTPIAQKRTQKPEPRALVYTVQRGDSLAKISKRFFGTARLAKELAETNGIDDPGKLRVGQKLVIGAPPPARPATPDPVADQLRRARALLLEAERATDPKQRRAAFDAAEKAFMTARRAMWAAETDRDEAPARPAKTDKLPAP